MGKDDHGHYNNATSHDDSSSSFGSDPDEDEDKGYPFTPKHN